MNAIIGMAKIADTTADLGKLKYCLSTIEASSTHLLGIINDVLDMSKIEAGKLEIDSSPMNVEKMLMKICNLIVDKTEQKSQKLNIILGENMGMHYIGDELRLSQVVTNLLSNAVKFTPEKGEITLKVDAAQEEGNDSVLRFSVADTGIGMTKEQNGIWVESEPDHGSTFIFEIRLECSPQQNTTMIFDGICPSDLRVLIVDGDEELRAYFQSITERFGIHTEAADSGKRAIYLVDLAKELKKPYDVIFLDYDMPDMNGIEVVSNLNARHLHVPVLY